MVIFQAYDGPDSNSRLIGTYCGFEAPNPIFSSGNSLYFESQMKHNMGLFYLIYMATDQGILNIHFCTASCIRLL